MDTLCHCIEKMFSMSPDSTKKEAFKRAWFERVAVEYHDLTNLYTQEDSRKILIQKYGWEKFVDSEYNFIFSDNELNELDAPKGVVEYEESMTSIEDELKEEGHEFYVVADSITESSEILTSSRL